MIPGVVYVYAVIFTAAIGGLTLAERRRNRLFRAVRRPLSSHRCRAWPLFSQLGTTSFQFDGVVEVCDDPTVPPGTPFSLRLAHPNRRSDYLFSKVHAAVERGHAVFVEVEDFVTARKARLCANGWTVVLDVTHSAGWPTCALETCAH